MLKNKLCLPAAVFLLVLFMQTGAANEAMMMISTVKSQDGVEIAYLSCGKGEVTLVFIHGGYADKGYWHHQVKRFSAGYCVIAVDLAGHGESGKNRAKLTMPTFAGDVKAVLERPKQFNKHLQTYVSELIKRKK